MRRRSKGDARPYGHFRRRLHAQHPHDPGPDPFSSHRLRGWNRRSWRSADHNPARQRNIDLDERVPRCGRHQFESEGRRRLLHHIADARTSVRRGDRPCSLCRAGNLGRLLLCGLRRRRHRPPWDRRRLTAAGSRRCCCPCHGCACLDRRRLGDTLPIRRHGASRRCAAFVRSWSRRALEHRASQSQFRIDEWLG